MNRRFVLDSSLAISWCAQGERTQATEAILDSFVQGSSAVVPTLWALEVSNVLLMAERAGKIDSAKRHQQIALLRKLPITVDDKSHEQAWSETSALAHKHKLSIYDACYLELALRQGLPLGTLDKRLRDAARKEGTKCLPGRF